MTPFSMVTDEIAEQLEKLLVPHVVTDEGSVTAVKASQS